MLRSLLVLSLFVFTFIAANAQKINIGDFKQEPNGNIYLQLNISEKYSARERYDVQLFSSLNGGEFRRLSVTKKDVAPGQQVTFDLSPSDLGGQGSQLRLRVEIEATTFPLVVSGDSKVKKGKQLEVSWTGYQNRAPYTVELIDGLNRSIPLGTVDANKLIRQLPKNIEKGNYTLRVTPSENSAAYGEKDLKISGGSPLLIIAPIALGGGAAAYFLLGGEPTPDGPGGGGGGENLPDPPADPDNQ